MFVCEINARTYLNVKHEIRLIRMCKKVILFCMTITTVDIIDFYVHSYA